MDEPTVDRAEAWTPTALVLFVVAGIFGWLTVFFAWLSQRNEFDSTRLGSNYYQCPLPGWIDRMWYVGGSGVIVGVAVLLGGVVRVVTASGPRRHRRIAGTALIVLGVVLGLWGLVTMNLMTDTAEPCFID